MRSRPLCLGTFLLILCAPAALAEISGGLRDAAARIDYGWYTGDRALVLAARDSLDLSIREPWALYLRAYGAYRAAQLNLVLGAEAGEELASCAADAESAGANEAIAAEASVLVVACSAMAAAAEPLRAVWHQRRLRQGLEHARALAAGNPRLMLVLRQHVGDTGIPAEAVVDAFRMSRARNAFPDWGEAEALLTQGELRLAAGDLRGARDALEETLLIAPDYTAALELKSRIGASTPAH